MGSKKGMKLDLCLISNETSAGRTCFLTLPALLHLAAIRKASMNNEDDEGKEETGGADMHGADSTEEKMLFMVDQNAAVEDKSTPFSLSLTILSWF
jgi:hypothetical protein